jgi:hypothetical protein
VTCIWTTRPSARPRISPPAWNGLTQYAPINADGSFASSFAAGGLAIGTYPVSYNYAGDNFTEATAHTDSVTVLYGFRGLQAPWVPNFGGGFKVNSAIPLKWQYTNAAGVVVDSATANPTIVINGPYLCGGADTADVIQVTAAGSSGYQYGATTKT